MTLTSRSVPPSTELLPSAAPSSVHHFVATPVRRFWADEVRLQLGVLACNLGHLWGRLGLPQRIKSWPLTSLQQRLMKTAGRLVKHARYYWLLLAEGHLNRRLFGEMLGRLAALPEPGG